MTAKQLTGLAGAWMILALWSTVALAQAAVYSGRLVSAAGGRLIIHEQSGQERAFTIARDATIVRDGQSAKLDDLKSADDVTVTLDEKMVAVAIDAKSGAKPPRIAAVSMIADSSGAQEYEGSVVSAADGRITIVRQGSSTQQSWTVADDAAIRRNGRNAKLEELSNGDRVKVMTEVRLLISEVVTVIEATSRT
jgi:hypothetical protein